jgi:mono/diheme cytochrome c family protein
MSGHYDRRHVVLAAICGGVLVSAALGSIGLCIVGFGWFDVAASSPHGWLVYWVTHTTMIRAVETEARTITAPKNFTAAQVARGFRAYDSECVMCHGGPGVARAAWVSGVNPPPPYLLDAARQWTPSELKVIVANGLKMTAMPAWSATHSDAQAWDMVAFIERLHGMTAAQYTRMRAAASHRGSGAH